MKILINTPDLSKHGGGVTNHYKGLKPYWPFKVKYNAVGKRKGIPGPIILVYDYIKFIFLCVFGKYDIILLNPSLIGRAIKRDALFLKIAHWFKINTVVFIHGWNEELAKKISVNPQNFVRQYNKADRIIVLASIFKERLIKWGISIPISLSTTKVNDQLLEGFNYKKNSSNQTILFLARVEENKGIMIALKAFKEVIKYYPDARFKIAGNGNALGKAKQFVEKESLEKVEFLGNISGENLKNTFSQATIYILPTTHGEGMPTSILEAMAFGLPIVSRPVGGLVDFFEEGKMGYLLESLNPKDYSEKLIALLNNSEICDSIAHYNHIYAKNNFMASQVALNLENILNT